MTINFDSELEKSERWMDAAATIIDNVSFESSDRARTAVSLLHLCMEHQQGIHVLAATNITASALALLRPLFESYVRGTWIYACATDEAISKYIAGGELPYAGTMMEQLAAQEARLLLLPKIKQSIFPYLHDLTHGGATQMKVRVSRDEIRSGYSPEHMARSIRWARYISFLAALEIARICGRGLAPFLRTVCLTSQAAASNCMGLT